MADIRVDFKFSGGKQTEIFENMSLSEFVYQAPEMDIDFDMITKIEVV